MCFIIYSILQSMQVSRANMKRATLPIVPYYQRVLVHSNSEQLLQEMENINDIDDISVEQYESHIGEDQGIVLETEGQLSQHQK
jgi:hypothetical protein